MNRSVLVELSSMMLVRSYDSTTTCSSSDKDSSSMAEVL